MYQYVAHSVGSLPKASSTHYFVDDRNTCLPKLLISVITPPGCLTFINRPIYNTPPSSFLSRKDDGGVLSYSSAPYDLYPKFLLRYIFFPALPCCGMTYKYTTRARQYSGESSERVPRPSEPTRKTITLNGIFQTKAQTI